MELAEKENDTVSRRPATFTKADLARALTVAREHGMTVEVAAEHGGTAHQLMSMYGWSRLDEAELYTREADRRRNAAVAAGHIEKGMRG